MRLLLDLVLALLPALAAPGASGQTVEDPYLAALTSRSASQLAAWDREHPWRVGTRLAEELRAWAADVRAGREDAALLRADGLRFAIDGLEDPALTEWVEAVLSLSPTELELDQRDGVRLEGAAGDPDLLEELLERLASRPEVCLLASERWIRVAGELYAQRRFEPARRVADAVEFQARACREGQALAWARHFDGSYLWLQSDLRGARTAYAEALELRRALDHPHSAIQLLTDLSSICLNLGRLEKALGYAEESERLARELGSEKRLRQALESRASILMELGEPLATLDALAMLEAETSRAADDLEVRIDVLRSHALSDIGRLESSYTCAKRALELARGAALRAQAPYLLPTVQLSTGLLLGDLGRFDEGLAMLDEAAATFDEVGNGLGRAWADKNRGWILTRARRFDEAEQAFASAQALGAAEDLPFLEGWCALGRAENALADERRPPPTELCQRWLEIAAQRQEELVDSHLAWRLSAARARLAARAGDPESALEHARRAVADLERFRRRLELPALVTHFLRDKADPYREAAFAAARLGRAEEAFAYAELLRGRRLFEDRSAPPRDPLAGGLDAPRDSNGARALAEARRRVAIAESRLRSTEAESPREERLAALREAERGLDEALLASELEAERPERPGNLSPPELSPADLRLEPLCRGLAEAGLERLVGYLVGERESLLFVLTPAGLELHPIDAGRADLAGLVARIRAPIEALHRGQLDLLNLGFDVAAARELHRLLLAPADLRPGERLAVVPDGPLWALSFDLCVSGDATTPGPAVDPSRPFAHLSSLPFLVRDHALSTLPAASLLALPPPRPILGAEPRTLALLAPEDPGLEGVEREVSVFGAHPEVFGEAFVLRGAGAGHLRELAPRASLLHLAAHGTWDAEYPALSHLEFVDVDGAPERFEAWEAEQLQLRAELVVLAACHSGRGAAWAGVGLFGLTRSFLIAGAGEVVASLWAVETRTTSDLFERFYEGLAAGAPSDEALRLARLSILDGTDPRGFSRAHPYFWAAWVSHRAR